MSLRERYDHLRAVALLDDQRVGEIIAAARPRAAALLPSRQSAGDPRVSGRLVAPSAATGGSLIPAWPSLNPDGSATIEYVADWGVLLAGWSEAAGASDEPDLDPDLDIDGLIGSGERLWVGIANDVLQMFVPNPPEGTYSMVRHHALMLGAATLWLGPERARLWQQVHTVAARAFLRRLSGVSLWDGVSAAERGLTMLLADPRSRAQPTEVLGWLERDVAAAAAYRAFHGAASLGIAALLATAPAAGDPTSWLCNLVHHEHPRPEFNRDRIETFASAVA